jgi:hypothetical protein
MTELVKAIEAEPSLKELVNNTLKSQSQQASVINNQKLADFIKNVFQGNTIRFFGLSYATYRIIRNETLIEKDIWRFLSIIFV